jgi:hypothetical protein
MIRMIVFDMSMFTSTSALTELAHFRGHSNKASKKDCLTAASS